MLHGQCVITIPAQVTSMANTTTCYASSNMAGFRQKPITSFLVITWTEENNHWKQFASFWRTRSNILKISSSCAVTTKVPVSIGYTVFMMNVRTVSLPYSPNCLSDYCCFPYKQANADITLNYGKHSQTASTVSLSLLLSTRRSSQCMAV